MFHDDNFHPFSTNFGYIATNVRDREHQATSTGDIGALNDDNPFIDTTIVGGGLTSGIANNSFSPDMEYGPSSYEASMKSLGHAGVDSHHDYTEWPAFGVSSQTVVSFIQATTPGGAEPNSLLPELSIYGQQNAASSVAFHMWPGEHNSPHAASSTSSDTSPDTSSTPPDSLLKSAPSSGQKRESFLEMLHGPGYLSLLAKNSTGNEILGTSSRGISVPSPNLVNALGANDGKLEANGRIPFIASVGPLQNTGPDPCTSSQEVGNSYICHEHIRTEVPKEAIQGDKGRPLLATDTGARNEDAETRTTRVAVSSASTVSDVPNTTPRHSGEEGKLRASPPLSPKQLLGRAVRHKPYTVQGTTVISKNQCSHGCGYSSGDRRTLARHEKLHTRTKNDHWFCPGVQAERGLEERPCTCPALGYTRRDRLLAHLRRQEEGSTCYEAAWSLGWRPSVEGSVKKLKNFRPTRSQVSPDPSPSQ